MQRSLPLFAVLALLSASAALAQTTPPASPGTRNPTGSSNPAVNTTGNAPSNRQSLWDCNHRGGLGAGEGRQQFH